MSAVISGLSLIMLFNPCLKSEAIDCQELRLPRYANEPGRGLIREEEEDDRGRGHRRTKDARIGTGAFPIHATDRAS